MPHKCTPDQKHERERIEAFSFASGSHQLYNHGILRDIYLDNFLTHHQLDADVLGQALRDWITSSPDHGVLEHYCQDIYRWSVPEDKIQPVTDVMWKAGRLLTRDEAEEYVYQLGLAERPACRQPGWHLKDPRPVPGDPSTW
ncbi:hypothetical protein Pan265_27070 [Mucisphaera calidilacus]|uniref:Uncharacterized protein n=1 Tax=Mucisphaera calidilacus TaxID=2527982 RepID=A0A518C0S6_9BACT|nr:hypothetical protein Pan265_27070 [Mucisphaera calidilacus]